MTTEARVRKTLTEIVDPCSAATGSNLNLVEMGLLKSVDVIDGTARVEIRLTTPMCHMVSYFHKEIEERVGDLPRIEAVEVDNDAGFEWTEEMMSDEAKQKRQAVLDEHESRYRREMAAGSMSSDT